MSDLKGETPKYQIIDEVTQEVYKDEVEMQHHEYRPSIYEMECRCGLDKLNPVHGDSAHRPDPNTEHPFDRRPLTPFCYCGKPLWGPVHDVYKFEKERSDESTD